MSARNEFFANFLITYDEALKALDVQALSLETGGYSRQVVDTAFRIVHTLKGDASFHGITAVKSICVVIEEVFCDLRRDGNLFSDEAIRLLWSGIALLRRYYLDLSKGAGVAAHTNDEEAFWDIVAAFTEKDQPLCDESKARYMIGECDVTAEFTLIRSLLAKAQSPDGGHAECDMTIVLRQFADRLSGIGEHDLADSLRTWCDDADMASSDDGRINSYLIAGLEQLAANLDKKIVVTKGLASGESIRVDIPRSVYDLEKSFRVEDSKIEDILACTQRFENLIAQLRLLHSDLLSDAATVLAGRRLGTIVNAASETMYDMFQRVTMLRFIDPSAFLEKNKLLVQSLLRASQKKGIIEATARVYMIERRYFEIFDDVCLHVLRNAVDHGIESPHERRINGKNEVARITVDLCETDCNIELRIGDDGRGVDLGKVRHKAIARGLTTPEAAAALDDRSLLQMLFSPGFSTTDVPSDISGRGVGLDVVKQRVESAHGIIDVETSPGKGTLFVVRLPKSERHYG